MSSDLPPCDPSIETCDPAPEQPPAESGPAGPGGVNALLHQYSMLIAGAAQLSAGILGTMDAEDFAATFTAAAGAVGVVFGLHKAFMGFDPASCDAP